MNTEKETRRSRLSAIWVFLDYLERDYKRLHLEESEKYMTEMKEILHKAIALEESDGKP